MTEHKLLIDALREEGATLYREADEVFKPEGTHQTYDAALILLSLASHVAKQGDILRQFGAVNESATLYTGSDLLVTLALYLESKPEAREDLSTIYRDEIMPNYILPESSQETTDGDSAPTNHLSVVQDSGGSDNGPGFYI